MGLFDFFHRPYRLHEKLGEGQNSCVFRATREEPEFSMSQVVALKILKSKNHTQIWKSEFEKLVRIRSPHCVALYSWERIRGAPALALEYINGVTLGQLCERVKLNPEIFGEIRRQAVLGLKDLQDCRLFHGDLNLSNIMINAEGIVKLIDFGVHFDQGIDRTTVEFAHPQVIMGQRPNFDTDIYSLDKVIEHAKRLNHQLFINRFFVAEPSAETLSGLVNLAKVEFLGEPSTQLLQSPAQTSLWKSQVVPYVSLIACGVIIAAGKCSDSKFNQQAPKKGTAKLMPSKQFIFFKTHKLVTPLDWHNVEQVGFNRFLFHDINSLDFKVKIGQKTFTVPVSKDRSSKTIEEKDLVNSEVFQTTKK